MNNFEAPISKEQNSFDVVLGEVIEEIKKTEETKKQLLANKKLGPEFYRSVVDNLEKRLNRKFNLDPDFEEIISKKIVKRIKEVVGKGGFSIESNKKFENVIVEDEVDLDDEEPEEVREEWGIGRGLPDELTDNQILAQQERLRNMARLQDDDKD